MNFIRYLHTLPGEIKCSIHRQTMYKPESAPPHSGARSSQVESTEFCNAMGQFATGITIISCRTATGKPVGLTINSFNSVSLSPPLVLWSLSRRFKNFAAFEETQYYGVSVLSAEQENLSRRFAAFHGNRFDGVKTQPGMFSVPLIEGALAHFECRVRTRHYEGDHVIVVGEVMNCTHREGPALVYKARRYGAI
jgi:flavin reductase (DIM6/NTAB) family NADH-FMN oxidoreductase RutF